MTGLHHQSLSTSDTSPQEEAWGDAALEEAALQKIIHLTERLLKVRPLGPESRFIDLTSDIRKAFIFLREFQRRFDFDLPLSAFFDAPTLRDLAHVAVTGKMPPLSQLVLLRAGDRDIPPLFLMPGLGGVVFELLELSKQLDYAGPIYAFAAAGLDGVDMPCKDTLQFSQQNFSLARAAYPTGPYRFIGHSSGGVSAFEMTRCAGNSGAEVDFFGVLDTNFAERAWPLGIWLRFMLQRITQSTTDETDEIPISTQANSGKVAGSGRLTDKLSGLLNKVANGVLRLKRKVGHRFFGDPSSEIFVKADPYYIPNLPPKFQRVRDAAITMAVCYRPTYYDCDLFLFQAELGDALACDPVLTWSRFVRKIILRPTPGDHMTMLIQPHVVKVAKEVSTCLAEVEMARRQSIGERLRDSAREAI
jgi:thioesterase domain-containing protein